MDIVTWAGPEGRRSVQADKLKRKIAGRKAGAVGV
jgi:hypothetical protein